MHVQIFVLHIQNLGDLNIDNNVFTIVILFFFQLLIPTGFLDSLMLQLMLKTVLWWLAAVTINGMIYPAINGEDLSVRRIEEDGRSATYYFWWLHCWTRKKVVLIVPHYFCSDRRKKNTLNLEQDKLMHNIFLCFYFEHLTFCGGIYQPLPLFPVSFSS